MSDTYSKLSELIIVPTVELRKMHVQKDQWVAQGHKSQ